MLACVLLRVLLRTLRTRIESPRLRLCRAVLGESGNCLRKRRIGFLSRLGGSSAVVECPARCWRIPLKTVSLKVTVLAICLLRVGCWKPGVPEMRFVEEESSGVVELSCFAFQGSLHRF